MTFDDLRIGTTASLSRVVTDADIRAFAEASLDRNPVHLSDEYAAKTRFRGRIAHGTIALGLISAVLGTQLPGAGTIYLSQSARFLAPIRPGDTITATVEVTKLQPERRVATLSTTCRNAGGTLLIEGEAVVLVEEAR